MLSFLLVLACGVKKQPLGVRLDIRPEIPQHKQAKSSPEQTEKINKHQQIRK